MYTNQYKIKKNRLYFLFIFFMTAGLVSCQSYKNLHEAPSVDTNGIMRDADDNGDTVTIANIPWKDYFSDEKLQALIAEGIENNFDLKIALSRIKKAQANLSMARASLAPALSAGAEVSPTWTSSGDHGKDILSYATNQNSLGFSASWEVDLWGKLNSQSKAKYANYVNSLEYRDLIQTELIANIANAYYQLLAYDAELKITKETIASLQETATTMIALEKAGEQNAASVEQTNAQLYSNQLSVPIIESEIRQEENAICILLGRKPGSIDRTSIDNQTVSGHLDYGVPAQVLSKRPDVKQAEMDLLAAYATTDAAKADLYPSLSISSASFGLTSGHFSDFFKPENIAANIVANLSQPIFNKKQARGNLEVARAEQEEALLTFQSTVLSAGQEVSDILYNYKASISKNEYRKKQITSLKNSVNYTHKLLIAGESTYTEVLSAQRDLLSAQLDQVDDKLEQLQYEVNLYKALGGGTY